MKPFDGEMNYDQEFKSMKKKVENTLTNEQQITTFHQLNNKMGQERAKRARSSRYVYYFSLTFATLLLAILILPSSLTIFQHGSGGTNPGVIDKDQQVEQENQTAERNDNTVEYGTDITSFDPGHMRLDDIRTELQEHANTLEERGDYIGYTYSIDHLFQYLLAIHYGDVELLDDSYDYQYSFSSFDQLVDAYHTHVDFSFAELKHMEHEGYHIKVNISIRSRITGEQVSLQYDLDYSEHRLVDSLSLGEFSSRTGFLMELLSRIAM